MTLPLPKKIMFGAPVGEKGGGEVVLRDIARALDRTRWTPLAQNLLSITRMAVAVPDVVASMNAGLQAAQGEIVALTDDTSPWPDWLARIKAHFHADSRVGGVGGRDRLTTERGTCTLVGKVQWWGRVIGNHHLEIRALRPVDLLKSANCAYRSDPLKCIGFDTHLRGDGAQVHWKLAAGLAMKRFGWTLMYDPAASLDHFPATRAGDEQNHRHGFRPKPHTDAVFNETLLLLQYLPPLRKLIFVGWALAVGTAWQPGFLQFSRLCLSRNPHAVSRWRATMSGKILGLREYGQESKKGRPHSAAKMVSAQ